MRQGSLPPSFESQFRGDEENLDTIMSSDAENQGIYELPPRLAARLNRPARKSAASSRRSSMSSLHSVRNGRTCSSRIHNTHIAQELRRTSIIESRKARLADKAAHAEKVRLRAHEAKSAPRNSRGEDRALAAQQAREQYLAQVASNCAEEVKRAKKIAEETREKRAIEYAKLRGEMNERLVMAEKRRLQYQQNQRRHRTPSQATAEHRKPMLGAKEPMTQKFAARYIQTTWRGNRRRKILADFLDLELDIVNVQTKSFDDISKMLSQDDLITKTGRLMKLCGLQDVIGGPGGEILAIKTFLSAYLLLGHPQHVLSHEGDREEELMDRAKVLLMQFQRVISKQPTEANFALTSPMIISLSEAYSDFQLAFEAWKNHDSTNFIETMLAQFAELDAIWQSVKNDNTGNVAADYKDGIRYNQTILLARLKRLIGPEKALRLVNDAVQARRRSKGIKRPVGDVRPRSATTQQPGIVKLEETPPPESKEAAKTLISSHELKNLISPLPENRVVVHELLVNKEYRIDVDTTSEVRQKLRRTVFDAMRRDLDTGDGNKWISSMAEILREKLLRVIPAGKPLHAQVSEAIDLSIIKNQLSIGSFSYEKFFLFMNNLLPKLVSPARDPLVKALVADTSNDYVERLAKLMNIIDLLSLDYSNYLLMYSAPELVKHAASYEQSCFTKQIGNKPLTKTKQWWIKAREKAIAEASNRSNSTSPSPPSSQKIYITGLIDIFISIQPFQPETIPETLELDNSRIQKTRNEILKIVAIASIILTAKNLLKRDVRVRWKTQVQRMWDLPESTAFTDSNPYLSILESSQALPPTTKTSLAGTLDRVLHDARSVPNFSHPVMKVLLQKIKTHVLARLSAAGSEERLRLATSASEVLSSGGLAEFVDRIGSVVEEMGKVKQVDWDAHGKWLDEVAGEVAREHQN